MATGGSKNRQALLLPQFAVHPAPAIGKISVPVGELPIGLIGLLGLCPGTGVTGEIGAPIGFDVPAGAGCVGDTGAADGPELTGDELPRTG